jgi:SnoaL-like domain
MTEALKIAQHYFALSNKSDLSGIENLLTDSTTYSSQTTGIYLGRDDILKMQRAFHGKFLSLNWRVNSVEEVKPGVVLFDYGFVGELPNGEKIASSGLEYVIVYQGKIQHIEIKNK